jgi:hypothetical protein
MRSIVKAVNLNKYYDQYHALRDINIEVEQGEVMCGNKLKRWNTMPVARRWRGNQGQG